MDGWVSGIPRLYRKAVEKKYIQPVPLSPGQTQNVQKCVGVVGFLQYFLVSKSPLSPLSSPPRTEDLSLRLSLPAVLWSSQDKENDISGKALFLARWHTRLQEIVPERLTFTENLSVTTVSHL